MLVCGLDIGAATTKAVILNNRRMVSYSVLPTGQSVNLATDKVLEEATRKLGLGMADFARVVTTGYGRHAVPFAHRWTGVGPGIMVSLSASIRCLRALRAAGATRHEPAGL